MKSAIKVEMEMRSRMTCYTHLPRSKTPSPHTLSSPRTGLPLPPGKTSPSAHHLHLRSRHLPLSSALTISGEQILIGRVNSSQPLDFSGIFLWPCFCSSPFASFLEKRKGVSTHWLSSSSPHSLLNPPPLTSPRDFLFESWFLLILERL